MDNNHINFYQVLENILKLKVYFYIPGDVDMYCENFELVVGLSLEYEEQIGYTNQYKLKLKVK